VNGTVFCARNGRCDIFEIHGTPASFMELAGFTGSSSITGEVGFAVLSSCQLFIGTVHPWGMLTSDNAWMMMRWGGVLVRL
jgi:hypothetical protein